jgi:hypothetical protein
MLGIEFTLLAHDGSQPYLNSLIAGLTVYYGHDGNEIKGCLVDLSGANTISAGERAILEIEGIIEITHALGADINSRPVELTVVNSIKPDQSILPEKFALHQNHPNPFNPATEISFDLPVAKHVLINIYNITGQKVTTLADGYFEAGSHSVTWDGTRNASGVYFYRIQAGEFTETRKMTLLK